MTVIEFSSRVASSVETPKKFRALGSWRTSERGFAGACFGLHGAAGSHHAALLQRRYVAGSITYLFENGGGLRAERLRRHADRRRLAVISDRMVDQRDIGAAGAWKRRESAHVPHLRVRHDFGVGITARMPDSGLFERGRGLRHCHDRKPAFDGCAGFLAASEVLGVGNTLRLRNLNRGINLAQRRER